MAAAQRHDGAVAIAAPLATAGYEARRRALRVGRVALGVRAAASKYLPWRVRLSRRAAYAYEDAGRRRRARGRRHASTGRLLRAPRRAARAPRADERLRAPRPAVLGFKLAVADAPRRPRRARRAARRAPQRRRARARARAARRCSTPTRARCATGSLPPRRGRRRRRRGRGRAPRVLAARAPARGCSTTSSASARRPRVARRGRAQAGQRGGRLAAGQLGRPSRPAARGDDALKARARSPPLTTPQLVELAAGVPRAELGALLARDRGRARRHRRRGR